MAVSLTINGTAYSFPQTGDSLWGDNVTNWATAATSGMLQKAGGNFTLTADVNFGASFGLLSKYFTSVTSTPAVAGVVRLANTDAIKWRNAGNSADMPFGVDTSNNLTYNSIAIASSSGIVNANIAAGAAIAYSKLNLIGSILNADISASAAIVRSKIDTGSGNYVVINSNDGHLSEEINLSVVRGGTGAGTLTANNVILGNGTSSVQFVAPSTSGNVLTSNGTTWQSSTPSTAPDSCEFYTNGSIAASVAANALTIALKDKTGADANGGSPVKIAFRNATAATGTYNYRSVTAALSVVIPASTTIGQVSAVAEFIYVYALDNAGTVELALSTTNIFDEWSVQNTSAISGGSSRVTLYSTTARTGVPIRLIGRLKSNQSTAGTWASSATEISSIINQPKAEYHEVKVTTGNGYGSTNTKIRRFSVTEINVGSAITYADSAGNGASFTINDAGIYAICYSDYRTGAVSAIGVSKNSSQLTIAIQSITSTDRVCVTNAPTTSPTSVSCVVRCIPGDVIRVHTDGTTDSTDIYCAFRLTKLSL